MPTGDKGTNLPNSSTKNLSPFGGDHEHSFQIIHAELSVMEKKSRCRLD
jgi:hypothetical protein